MGPTKTLAFDDTAHDLLLMICFVSVCLLLLIFGSGWKLFQKAGIPGWHACIPGLNIVQLARISGKRGFYAILLLIPLVNILALVILVMGLARNFGKGLGFALGLLFMPLPFFPILAFDESRYMGKRIFAHKDPLRDDLGLRKTKQMVKESPEQDDLKVA